MRRLLSLLALAGIAAAPAAALAAAPPPADPEDQKAPIPAGFFRLAAETRLPGKSPDWDYLAYDPGHARLFVARRGDGLWAFDTRANRLIRKIAESDGAGATLLIPALHRGFSTNEDGSSTEFDLDTLATLRRFKFADDADAASYDPVTGRIAFVSADSQQVTFVDPRTRAVTGRVKLAAKKADGSAADGAGHILVNERDRNAVAVIDVAGARQVAEWPTTGCTQPTGMAIDPVAHRAFVGCRSDKPVLAVMNIDSGAVVQTLALGRGNDGVVWDARRQEVLTTNGIEANIVVYAQLDADHYAMTQAIATRPEARTMAFDPIRRRIFTVTAQGVVNPQEHVNTGPSVFYPNAYYDDSFIVLTYK